MQAKLASALVVGACGPDAGSVAWIVFGAALLVGYAVLTAALAARAVRPPRKMAPKEDRDGEA